MISPHVKRRVDLVAALADVGCDVASLEPMTKFQRIRALAPYIERCVYKQGRVSPKIPRFEQGVEVSE